MTDRRAQARERQRRCRKRQRNGLAVWRVNVDEVVLDDAGELLHDPHVHRLVSAVLVALLVTRDRAVIEDALRSVVDRHGGNHG